MSKSRKRIHCPVCNELPQTHITDFGYICSNYHAWSPYSGKEITFDFFDKRQKIIEEQDKRIEELKRQLSLLT